MSISIGKTALQLNETALNTVGKNISHANDPSYTRQRVHTTSTSQGFIINRVEQVVNESLEKDILREKSKLGLLSTKSDILDQIENSINELTDNDLSSVLDEFYNSLEQLSLNPHDVPLRQTVIQSAQKVTDMFHLVSSNYNNLEDSVDQQIGDTSLVINSLLTQIADVNLEVAKREGGATPSPANDLRDTRRALLSELSELIDINTSELSNGTTLVTSNGRTLVFQGETRKTYIDRTNGQNEVRFVGDNAFVKPDGGSLGGLIYGRDTLLKNKKSELDTLAATFAWEINKIQNTGRGLDGVSKMTAQTQVSPNYISTALDSVVVDALSLGNQFKAQNGAMTFSIRNDASGQEDTFTIDVTLVGDNKSTLTSIKNEISQITNLDASIDNFGRLIIDSDEGYSFFIKEDTSNLSSFLGLNNFFDGNSASSLSINEDLNTNPSLFAAAKSAAPGDNSNLTLMIQTKSTDIGNNTTLFQSYENYVSSVATEAGSIKALEENQERILVDVQTKRDEISGVNLDEAAANLLKYQKAYQAAAQYISIQNQLLDLLFSSV